MDTIIDTLLEIDRNAREMVENAAKQRESSVPTWQMSRKRSI